MRADWPQVSPLSLSVLGAVQSLVCEAPAPASFRLSPRDISVTLGRDREEADLHEAPSPPNGLGGVKRPQGHLPAAQEPEEATSCEGPTMAWMVLLLGVLAYSSGQGWGLCSLGGHESRASG